MCCFILTAVCRAEPTDYLTQKATPVTAVHSNFEQTTFTWNHITWEIPSRFYYGNQGSTSQFVLYLGWRKDGVFLPVERSGYDVSVSVIVNNKGYRDNNVILQKLAPLKVVNRISSARLKGLTYLGSDANAHFFSIDTIPDAYLKCSSFGTKLLAPMAEPDVLYSELRCRATMPIGVRTYAIIESSNATLNDIGLIYSAVYRTILSFEKDR